MIKIGMKIMIERKRRAVGHMMIGCSLNAILAL